MVDLTNKLDRVWSVIDLGAGIRLILIGGSVDTSGLCPVHERREFGLMVQTPRLVQLNGLATKYRVHLDKKEEISWIEKNVFGGPSLHLSPLRFTQSGD